MQSALTRSVYCGMSHREVANARAADVVTCLPYHGATDMKAPWLNARKNATRAFNLSQPIDKTVGRRSMSVCALQDVEASPKGDLSLAKAFWLTPELFALDISSFPVDALFTLHASKAATLTLSPEGVEGADVAVPLCHQPGRLPAEVLEKFPHISHLAALCFSTSAAQPSVGQLLQCQLAISVSDAGGVPLDATSVQTAAVLDALYTYHGPLGVQFVHPNSPPPPSSSPSDSAPSALAFNLWAPTAQSVELLLFASSDPEEEPSLVLSMAALRRGTEGAADSDAALPPDCTGVWEANVSVDPSAGAQWTAGGGGAAVPVRCPYYLFRVTVFHPSTGKVETVTSTDPYSRGLSANGLRSFALDLASDPALKPSATWDELSRSGKPALSSLSDVSLYELHVRDFSATDETVPEEDRGGYSAFTHKESNGMRHLIQLATAGITHVHLLPTYDFATVDERKDTWQHLDEAALRSLPPDSHEQQEVVTQIKDLDAFNWGYDPVHWGVPEGSYASDPNGPSRVREFRAMVEALNACGLRVVLDVVYNHLYGSGPHSSHSCLDKVVPGYYLRRNLSGYVENSTCMNNTASEHAMVSRLIVDDLVMWATQYKVDGFRFDLMGHLMKDTLIKAREALNRLTLESDGIDGSKIIMYGEGWDFGEVSNNSRGVNGSQRNLAGTGIATFNDRIRDKAMGGSPFGDVALQGFSTGLFLDPNNGPLDEHTEQQQRQQLLAETDWVRAGLVGNLASYLFTSHTGEPLRGDEIRTHDGVSVGYTASPLEAVNYVSAHDNETLFDVINLKAPPSCPLGDRCRISLLASSIVAWSQGTPFFHAGDEILRSKSLDRDSYNSGDWFNRLDWSLESNNFGVGLPPYEKNHWKWDTMRPLLANPDLKPDQSLIASTFEAFKDLIRVRYSSPLFRLGTSNAVQERVTFLNSGRHSIPGAIIMQILDGEAGTPGMEQLDPVFRRLVVVFNARPKELQLKLSLLAGVTLSLHPIQAQGVDAIVKNAFFDVVEGYIFVPGRTSCVFVETR